MSTEEDNSQSFVENQCIILPNIENGPGAIGDLWNCVESKRVGSNIFRQDPDADHLKAVPREFSSYNLTHVRYSRDRMKNLAVSAEVSLELLNGMIKVSGSAEYESEELSNSLNEELKVHSVVETFYVEALPSAKANIDEHVEKQILEGKIKATHVVTKVFLGGEISATVFVQSADSNNVEKIGGSFAGKLMVGPISAQAKATLAMLDKDGKKEFNTKIVLNSKPTLKTPAPTSINEMFKTLESVNKTIEEKYHFPQLNTKDRIVFGVPLRFELVPISQFLEVDITKLYLSIKENVLQEFTQLFSVLKDLQVKDFIKKLILEKDHRISKVLNDNSNEYTIKITMIENELKNRAFNFFLKSNDILRDYKMKKITIREIMELLKEFREQFDEITIYKLDVENYANEGQKLIFDINHIEKEDKIKIFTNETLLSNWFSDESGIKILLQTKSSERIPGVLALYEIAEDLASRNISVGVAISNISQDFSLTLKIKEKSTKYKGDDITFAIRTISSLIDKGEKFSSRFFQICASIKGIKFTQAADQEYLKNLSSLISILQKFSFMTIAEEYPKLLDILEKKDDELKYVVIIEALYSSVDAIKKAFKFREKLPKGQWILGNFGVNNEFDAPAVIVFRNGKILAILSDNLDFHIAIDFLPGVILNENEISSIFFTEMVERFGKKDKNFIYPDKINFMSCIMSFYENNLKFQETPRKFKSKYPANNSVDDVLQILSAMVSMENFSMLRVFLNIINVHHEDIYRESNISSFYDNRGNIFVSSENLQKFENISNNLKENIHPFLIEVDLILEVIKTPGIDEDKIQEIAQKLKSNEKCPEKLKIFLNSKEKFQLNELQNELMKFKNGMINNSQNLHLASTLFIVESFINLFKSTQIIKDYNQIQYYGILIKYIDKIQPEKYWAENWREIVNQKLLQNDYYGMIDMFSHLRQNSTSFHIQKELNDILGLKKVEQISNILRVMKRHTFDDIEVENFISCPTFYHFLSIGFENPMVLECLSNLITIDGRIPNYISKDLKEKMLRISKLEEDNLESLFLDTNDALRKFESIIKSKIVPDNFNEILQKSLENPEFLKEMNGANVLYYYNMTDKSFTELWDIKTLENSYLKIQEFLERRENEKNMVDQSEIKFQLNLSMDNAINLECEENVNISLPFKTIVGHQNDKLTLKKFVELKKIVEKPQISEGTKFEIIKILPYFVQKIKMWGAYVLEPEFINDLVEKSNNFNYQSQGDNKAKFNFKSKSDLPTSSSIQISKSPLSKIDILTCLANTSDKVIFQDILKILSQFPIALPLVLKNLSVSEEQCHILYLELLKIAVLKWETLSGITQYNQLFVDNFKLIFAMRLSGSNKYTTGKSTILNQLFINKNTFSSKVEPGGNRGRPYFLDGAVELVAMTQESVVLSLWEQVLKYHYLSDKNEILLLANFHGNAANFQDLILSLGRYIYSYIVFITPQSVNDLENNCKQLVTMVNMNKTQVFLVDPLEGSEDVVDAEIVECSKLVSDDTIGKLRKSIKIAISNGCFQTKLSEKNSEKLIEEEIETLISLKFVNFIKSRSCFSIKEKLQFQKRNNLKLLNDIWRTDQEFLDLITLFTQNLSLCPVSLRYRAMVHIDREISSLTKKQTETCSNAIMDLKRKQKLIIEHNQSSVNEKATLQNRINRKNLELDNVSLGMEHMLREIGRIYDICQLNKLNPENSNVMKLPKFYSQLLYQGYSMEILDGDLGNMNKYWLNAIFHEVSLEYPKSKVFVVSILGLQSSGKSTLLNALFGCKFAVSTGRCTKGLFMRLLFLDEDLKKDLGVDILIIIDTEGLQAPEKTNDDDCDKKDRQMATFAMSISDLTLINVRGEAFNEMKEILQIVIVTLARLEEAKLSPDIFMIQHIPERDRALTLRAEEAFIEAINEGIKVSKKEVDVGARNFECLRKLEQRVQDGNVLKQFLSFKNGATVNSHPSKEYHNDVEDLFNKILDSCRNSKNPLTFQKWSELVTIYWDNVSKQDFALRFKNAKEWIAFMDRSNKMTGVKNVLVEALHSHKDDCEQHIRSKFQDWENKNEYEKFQTKTQMQEFVMQIISSIPLCTMGSDVMPSCRFCSNYMKESSEFLKEVENTDHQKDVQETITLFKRENVNSIQKQLKQYIDALELKYGVSCKFEKIINEKIQDAFQYKKVFTDEECQIKVEEIWNDIKRQVGLENTHISVKRRILTEAESKFENNYKLIEEIRINTINLPKFDQYPAFKHMFTKSGKLSFEQRTNLESAITKKVNWVVHEMKSNLFQAGTVTRLFDEVKDVIGKFTKDKLELDFIYIVHEYALKLFINILVQKETEWKKSNHPLTIMEINQRKYKNTIFKRLKYGLSFQGEGRIVGELIVRGLEKYANKIGNKEHINNFLGKTWLTSSSNVRLKYFGELASGIQAGDKSRAVEHFANPKERISQWFDKIVNSFSYSNGLRLRVYSDTFNSKMEFTVQKLENSKNILEIFEIAQHVFSLVEGVEYMEPTEINVKNATVHDFEIFRSAILNEIEEIVCQIKKMMNGEYGFKLELASKNPQVLKVLGCTEHCHWCGALGEHGHDQDVGDTRRHHTCHQPGGLLGVSYIDSQILVVRKCDETPLDAFPMRWHLHSDPSQKMEMTWKNAMAHPDFADWTFSSHSQNQFSDLMKWFFQVLHTDIASYFGLKPASVTEMIANGIGNLKLEPIMKEVKSKID